MTQKQQDQHDVLTTRATQVSHTEMEFPYLERPYSFIASEQQEEVPATLSINVSETVKSKDGLR